MKIVVIAGYAPSLINFRGPLLASMRVFGHEVITLAPPDDPTVRGQLAELGVGFKTIRLSRRGVNPLRDFITMQDIRARLAEIKPDLVLSYTIKPVIYGSLAARLEGVKLAYSMVTGLGSSFEGKGWIGRLIFGMVEGLYRIGLKRNRCVFFQNTDDEAFFRKLQLIGPQTRSVITAGSGVDLNHYAQAPLPEGPPTFLLIARLLKAKGIAEFAEAARLVKAEPSEARFHLVGPLEEGSGGGDERDLSRWRSEKLVDWFGLAEDVRPRLAEASVFVLPSYYGEGLPRTALEAAATGRAVITTDHPGCREAVVHGETGLLVPVRDPQALAEAMKRFINEPGLVESMGRAGRALAEQRFDVNKVNRMILEAMELC
ncbi:MAG: glycosyltransferase family 4 protein [Proteobacteria bacterium]|nr:glycosyltransferase family 4 protein [Pseudomonadota bacterium]MBU1611220.1 glycosyltransferase family 4 protein [Pseudomonadota bacterium]